VSHCGVGQVAKILQKSFENEEPLQDYIGQNFTCQNCKTENIVEDILSLIPESFLISSHNDISKFKSNQELKKWLESK